MRGWLAGSVIGLGLLAGLAHGEGPRPKAIWHDSYDAAKALARKSGKPLLVVFR